MKKLVHLRASIACAFLLVAAAGLAGNLTFEYRDPAGNLHPVTTMADVNNLFVVNTPDGGSYISDYRAYSILKEQISDVDDIKARVTDMGSDIKVTVNSCTDGTKCDPGSWSTGPEIQIQSWDSYRATSTLAHEVGHSYMKDKCGQNPTHGMTQVQKYGADKNHYVNEVTNEKTALSEGYAEYHGHREGQGQESVPCAGAGGLKNVLKENVFQDPTDGKWYLKYDPTKWDAVVSADDMWKTEGINAAIFRDLAKYIDKGADKIEALMCEDTLKEVLEKWALTHPGDAEAIAKIVDANTNYTMTDQEMKDLVGDIDYLNKRNDFKTKYKGKDPCVSVHEMLVQQDPGLPPPAGPGRSHGKGVALPKFR